MLSAVPAYASELGDLALECIAALDAGDQPGFDAAATAIKARDDVFDTEERAQAEECLTRGYGEPWEYWYASSSFEPSAAIEARIEAASDAKVAKERAVAQAAVDEAKANAAKAENAERVATMVYLSCSTLLARDEVAAMTSSVCVESFLANGLPTVPAP